MTTTAERIILDTDVASRLLRGRLEPDLAARLSGAVLLITFVTVGELWQGARHARWEPRRSGQLASWLGAMPMLAGSNAVARRWGDIRGAGLRIGLPLPVNDAWIAACCLVHGLGLATGNARHFASVEGLELIGGGHPGT